MKYLKFFLILGVAFIGLTSYSSRTTELSEIIRPGDLFPEISGLQNSTGERIKLSDLRGHKVFVNFWAAYDADSHRNNVIFANVMEKKSYPVRMVSMSLDKSKSVFEKTVVLDKIGASLQLWVDSSTQRELVDHKWLKDGFQNYLLNENGQIIAMNLNPEKLGQLLEVN